MEAKNLPKKRNEPNLDKILIFILCVFYPKPICTACGEPVEPSLPKCLAEVLTKAEACRSVEGLVRRIDLIHAMGKTPTRRGVVGC